MFRYYFVIINIIGIVICLVDKILAIKHMYRIPENVLLFICFIGGCFGFCIGMNTFRHKTKKLKFMFVYLLCIIWVVIIFKNNLLILLNLI
ncbi:MAG: DUF1294 domain-containing protein [Bacilli bacterium]|nr:DUF1294 domain-containing protein [Bacilli bacterium]